MIGRLSGKLVEKQPPRLVIDVGGVGYEVEAPMSTCFALAANGSVVTLLTQMIVREDAILLYGFATENERALFRELIKVSGIGAKLALTILSGMSVADFVATIEADDAARLTGLPGVGKKTAARLLVEMRDKLSGTAIAPSLQGGATSAAADAPAGPVGATGEAHQALVALGYKAAEADRLLRGLDPDGERDSEALIREALRRAVR
ncbi:Holliday junction branch migration protein RuvA [Salinisphaera sp. Q1T1-3]|uniref:Holliday junction branch migration protein RuvA n=1 Tax=Salinisphaera sp. Q1T1-3 TaxID=2321229 RepID=UPI000E74DEEF|nr:Holliday junction branch migration protein RuvA [Salinisphaera sp. Q1T1-3]RJS95265.1 Holliday junction branch migration protein RuvA [Salinisphaera sp. Q1T1-3]